ncbi:MAG: hypothetical protein ACK44S_07080 [Bacteroidota bacterium]|jgi:hypothetical protein
MRKIAFLLTILALYSCHSSKISTLSTPMYAPQATINPIRADIDIDMNKKLNGEANATYFLIFKISGNSRHYAEGVNFSGEKGIHSNLGRLKSAAAFKALNGTGADIIVHPNYEIQKHSYLFFSTVNLKVVGYAGYFKKFYQVPYDKK